MPLQTRIALLLMAFFAIAIALLSYRFIAIGLSEAFGGVGSARAGKYVPLSLHVAIAPVALLLGALQFFPAIRLHRPRLHRISGWIYAGCVAVSGLAALFIAGDVPGGWPSALGFGLLGVLWLLTTFIALFHIRKGNRDRHRQWMVRSYALTFAAVTLRAYLPVFMLNDMDYDAAAPWLAWLCWVPNLIFAEIVNSHIARSTN